MPGAAVALQVALAIGVVWMSTLVQLLGAIGFALGVSASATVVGLMVLRVREGAERVPIPGYPWIPGLFVTVNLGAALLMASREPLRAAVAFAVLAAGVAAYGVFGSRTQR